MGKKSGISPEQKALLNLEAKYNARLWRIYSTAADEAALLGASVDGSRLTEEAFTFDDFPGTKKRVDGLLKELHDDVQTNVVDGVRAFWELADEKNDALVREVFGDAADRLTDEQKARYFSNNDRALESFLSRKVNGMNLSQRVWRYTMEFRENIETVLDGGIREGKAAPEMAAELKRYLKYPDKLFRRVRGTDGRLHLSRPARAFHPGQGVYRSSYMNALRLSATENNIAYRTADFTRIQSLDFVVGIRIRLSNNHTLKNPRGGAPIPLYDICDELKGDYPKDFKFTGWHPFCRCHAETILKTRGEMDEGIREILNGGTPSSESVNSVRDVPESFRGWVERNGGRIAAAKKLPYFLADNAERYLPGVRFTRTAKVQIREAEKDAVYDRERIKFRRNQIKEAAKSLRDEDPISHKESRISITITGSGIDEFLNQPHKHYAEKNEMLLNIRSVIENSKYMGVSTHKGKVAHIFETELCGEKTWIIATDIKGRGISLHSISDSDRVLVGIKKTT